MFSRLAGKVSWRSAAGAALVGSSAVITTGSPRPIALADGKEIKTFDGWTVAAKDLNNLAVEILKKAGSSAKEAQIVADNLVESNLKGHDSHGVGYMTRYIPGMQAKMIKVNGGAKVISEKGAFVHIDGECSFGQVVGLQAMEKGIAKCKEQGVAIVGVKNSHHVARVGKWAEMAAKEGFVTVYFVNVAGHDPLVAPFAGTDARLGTNPYCIGFPGTDPEFPILLDYATSEVALGKVREFQTAGKPLRPGVLLDKNGKPTTDSNCIPPHNGCILPFGSEKSGYKGYGLALMCELWGGVLTGGYTIEPSYPRSDKVIVNSMTAVIIDPAMFGVSPTQLRSEVGKLCAYVKASPAGEGGSGVEVPGEMEKRYFQMRSAEGIPFTQGSYDAMMANAAKVGMNVDEAKQLLGGKRVKLYEDRTTRMSVYKGA